MITCEATSQGKTYAGVFITETKAGAEPGKEGAKDGPANPPKP